MNGFINKEDVLEDYFVCQDTSNARFFISRRAMLKSSLWVKEYFTLRLSYTGIEIKYYTDEELYKEFGDNLPSDIDGEIILFFNVEDACKKLGVN